MRKEVKQFSMSAKAILMVMVVFGTLFSSCYTKDDIPVVPDPVVVENQYIIEGTVVSYYLGVLETLNGVTVTCDKGGVVTAAGETNFIVKVSGPDTYTLTLKKDGYDEISYQVVVPKVNEQIQGQLISVSVQLSMYRENTTPTDKLIGVYGGEIEAGNSVLTIPAGALKENVDIRMTVKEDVEVASGVAELVQKAAAQFMLAEFTPDGQKFDIPAEWCVNYDKLQEYYLKDIELQYRKNSDAKWNVLAEEIEYADGKYSVSLDHFSQYRMVYKASAENVTSVPEELPAIAAIYNNEEPEKTVTEIPYTKYEGAELTFGESWNQISGTDRAQIEELVTKAISAKTLISEFEGVALNNDAKFTLKEPIKLTFDYHLLSKAVQSMDTYTFTFNVYNKTDDSVVALDVTMKAAGVVSMSVKNEFCGAHHHTHGHCGHIYNGGAGGGMVDGE